MGRPIDSSSIRYTVYDNKTDFPVIVEGTAREAAKVMGCLSLDIFYQTVTKCRKGVNKRWTILVHDLDNDDLFEDDD